MKAKLFFLALGAIALIALWGGRVSREGSPLALKENPPETKEDVTLHLPAARPKQVAQVLEEPPAIKFSPREREVAANGIRKLRASRRERVQTWKARLGPYISGRPMKISGAELHTVKGVRAYPLHSKSGEGKEVARVPGYVLREESGDTEGKIILYDSENDILLVASGKLTLEVEDISRQAGIEAGLGLKVTSADSTLNLLTVQTQAPSLEVLTSYLSVAKGLPGVLDARLDLVGPRAVPQ